MRVGAIERSEPVSAATICINASCLPVRNASIRARDEAELKAGCATMQLAKIIRIAQNGDIPLHEDGRDLYVCHTNDCNKDCVNIDHIEFGNPSQNSKDYYVSKLTFW